MEGVHALIVASGWASGLSLYLVVTLLGLAGRLGIVDVPDVLTSPWVLAAAATLYLVEFVVDKIPYVDDVWDAVHTLVRPAGAAALGWLLADSAGIEALTGSAAGSGTLALLAHAAKATTRAAVNTSPEPFSNTVVSLLEDGVVVGVLVLAAANPVLALVVVAILVAAGLAVTAALWRGLLRMRARRRERRTQAATRAGGVGERP